MDNTNIIQENELLSIKEFFRDLYLEFISKPKQVYEIFKDFYGENRVDLQGIMTVESFIEYMINERLSGYASSANPSFSDQEWKDILTKSIKELPYETVEPIIKNIKRTSSIKRFIALTYLPTINILVHFPTVTITNENNKSVTINHLWAKVPISYEGLLRDKFKLNRSEYPLLHLMDDYLHSHIMTIPFSDFTIFATPCLGSGPLNRTQEHLHYTFDEDIWSLFCLELDKYVTVESLEGRPYKYLERIGTNENYIIPTAFNVYGRLPKSLAPLKLEEFQNFIEYFIKTKQLKFNYRNSTFSIGMSFIEYIVAISNAFITWYNDKFNKGEITYNLNTLLHKELIMKVIIKDNSLYKIPDNSNVGKYLDYEGSKICTFKGKEIKLHITDTEIKNDYITSIVLNPKIASYILVIIFKILNYRYGRPTITEEANDLKIETRYI